MTRGVFIAGTDFGVGKSRIGKTLASLLTRRGECVRVHQPVETICALELDERSWLADRVESSTRDLQQLFAACVENNVADDFVLVESCGGFYSPISSHALNADLAEALALPVLVIAADHYGVVSPILMTVEAVRMRRLALAGVILNRPTPQSYSGISNAKTLERWLPVPVYRIPYEFGHENGTAQRGEAVLEQLVDAWLLDGTLSGSRHPHRPGPGVHP